MNNLIEFLVLIAGVVVPILAILAYGITRTEISRRKSISAYLKEVEERITSKE